MTLHVVISMIVELIDMLVARNILQKEDAIDIMAKGITEWYEKYGATLA